MAEEKVFNKYESRGNQNWREMTARDPRRFNSYQQARYDWILKMAGDVRGKKVLDIGSGGGSLSYLLAKRGANVTGIEYEERGVQFARENLASADRGQRLRCAFLQGSAYELPFEAETFDVAVSCEVIEHLQEPDRMLREAARVLKPGGKMVLTTPYRLSEVPHDENHVKEYYPGELKALVAKYFSDAAVKETHHMFWRTLYTYSVRVAGGRPLGKWAINALTLWFGWNPHLLDIKPGKFDLYSSLLAWGSKDARSVAP